VDDDEGARKTLRLALERENFSTTEAENGAVALNSPQQQTFDAVVCDLEMPVMDGKTFLLELRRKPQQESLPVLIFTASDDQRTKQDLLTAGANDFLGKSASVDSVVAWLKQPLARQIADFSPNYLLI